MRKLTKRQAAFVEAYDGNGTAAARLAGYAGADNVLAVQAGRLLRDARVAEAIREREASRRPHSPLGAHIATRKERQAFWTKVMLDGEAELAQRLKASELLGKSEGDFLERLEVGATQTLEQLVTAALERPNEIEARAVHGAQRDAATVLVDLAHETHAPRPTFESPPAVRP